MWVLLDFTLLTCSFSLCAPGVKQFLFSLHTVAPVSLASLSDLNVTSVEDNITLTCAASGYPLPSITWTHNGSVVLSGATDRPDFSITNTSSGRMVQSVLYIPYAMMNDSGMYACNISSPPYDTITNGPILVLVQGNLMCFIWKKN